MKYLADTITDYVAAQCMEERTYRFILPSYSARLLYMIGSQVNERLTRVVGRRVPLLYGVAYRLGQQWGASGSAQDKADLQLIRDRGWYNETDNLTSLRNRVASRDTEDALVTILAGYDHIDDRASLMDFFHLDDREVWESCLRSSFRPWVEARFRNVLDPDDDARTIGRIADVLRTVREHGLADLSAVSSYLETLDLTGVTSGSEAYRLVLGNLLAFGLPPMVGLAQERGRKSLKDYVGPAQEFANYSSFLDESARKKALKALRTFEASDPPEPDPEVLGQLASLDELLSALRRYVEQRSEPDREQLLTADFVYIREKVLGHKTKKTRTKRLSIRKLRGTPPEVFLRALWLALADYAADAKARLVVPDEDLHGICMRSLRFTHDFDAGGEGTSGVQADRALANAFLRQVLGGIDEFLEDHIQMGEGAGQSAVGLQSELVPSEQDTGLTYRKTHVAEPGLKFEIVMSCGKDEPFRREFVWCIPQNHPSRLLVDLYHWAVEGFHHSGNALPAYSIPYLPTIFMARDTEEVTRLLCVAVRNESRQPVDLLSAPGIEPSDPALAPLLGLSASYQAFLRAAEESGLFSALDKRYDDLRHAYVGACDVLLRQSTASSLQPLLLKAFFLVDDREAREKHWKWNSYQDCAIASPLHPAVLDMLRHQHTFLCESFCVYASEALHEMGGRKLTEEAWNRIMDLGRIERPIFGMLKDSSLVLDSNVRSYGYTHLLGECKTPAAQTSSRLLLEYDDEDDEEITNARLFQETRASALVCRTLLEYRELFAHADDGLSVGAYCGREIQPVIAGVDSFLEAILPKRTSPFGLKVIIFSAGRDDSSVIRWLNAWRDRWQEAEFSSSRSYYGNCRTSIAYRVVADDRNREQFARLLRETALDVMLFTDISEAGKSRLDDVSTEEFPDDGFRQFPVLEKTCCAVTGGGKSTQRERVLSHRRFALATLHTEVMARIVKGNMDPEQRHVVISQSDFRPWRAVIDAAHENSAWVVCLDPAVDDRLLRKTDSDGARKREIIGFGTGVGAHGESNYTVSTEQFALADVKRLIGAQLSTLFESWDSAVCERIAQSLISEASGMAGLSLVKATGPSQYVRDYIAYATLRKLLRRDSTAFCDETISLDAFHHWFEDGETATRPDLLRLQARIVDGCVDIEAQVFECKLAQHSEHHLSKAFDQVAAGLTRLIGYFRPRVQGKPIGVTDRPDQRYWWMQLHRLIASRGSTSKPRYEETLSALERLAEGLFTISWRGAAVAFWTDVDRGTWETETSWHLQVEGEEITIPALTCGSEMVRRICLDDADEDVFAGLPAIRRSFRGAGSEQLGGQSDKVPLEHSAAQQKAKKDPTPATDRSERTEVSTSAEQAPMLPAKVPDRVLLGHTLPGDRPVYWEFGHPELPNRHILVFGASGTGKTYTIQALLCELGKAEQNALIVDYTDGFITAQLDEIMRQRLNPSQLVVRREPLPINPFRQQCDFVDDEPLPEDSAITAQRVTGVFSEIYQLGDQQKSALYTAIRDGIAEEGTSFNLDGVMTRLDNRRAAGGPVASSAATVISRIEPLVDMHPFGPEDPESWERLYADTESRCHIIQLTGFSRDIAKLITEFSLIDLYRYFRTRGTKDKPRVVVLDEIQNLDHHIDSPLGQLLTEGRKFGISLVLATQTLSSLDNDARDRLFQASHKLFFKPADTELKSFAQILENAIGERRDEWIRRLSGLARGECYSLGPAKNDSTGRLDMKRSFKIRITALSKRF